MRPRMLTISGRTGSRDKEGSHLVVGEIKPKWDVRESWRNFEYMSANRI